MATVSAPDLALLRSEGQLAEVYLSIHKPETIWSARINDIPLIGQTSLDFDTGTGSDFALIEALQEVWVGSTLGSDDRGRLRIKSITSADAGVTGTLVVSGHSLSIADDDHLTFLFDYPLKPRRSLLDSNEELFMDDNVEYDTNNNNEDPKPVVIAGPHRAAFLGSPNTVFNVDASDSYAISDGTTTITTYGLTVLTTGVAPTVNFNTGTGLGDITFTAAGYYWAKYTVTDSETQSQVSYRLYVIHSSDKSDSWYPFVDFSKLLIRGDWDSGGWSLNFTSDDSHLLSDIPDHALVIAWQRTFFDYGATQDTVTFLPDDNKAIFVGYMADHNEVLDMDAGVGQVTFSARSVESRLRNLYGFSVSIEGKKSGINEWYEAKNWQYMGSIIHHTWRWRSTLFEVADVLDLNMDTERRFYAGLDQGNLYEMVDNFSMFEGIRAKLVTDQGGRFHLVYDQQLLNDTDRAALTTVFDIQKTGVIADYGGSLVIPRQPENKVPFITTSGSYWDGSFKDGVADIEDSSWCFVAPGGKGDWDGPDPVDFPKQMFRSLTHGKEVAGRFFAKENNEFIEVRFQFTGPAYLPVLDFAYGEMYTTTMQTVDTPRGILWVLKPLYLRDVMAEYNAMAGSWQVNAAFEPEADGYNGVQTECPSFPPLGGFPVFDFELPDPPGWPDLPGVNVPLLTGTSFYIKDTDDVAWTLQSSQAHNDFCVDPFWRIRTGSSDSADAIVWAVGDGFIKVSDDAGITWDDVTPSNLPHYPHATAVDEPDPVTDMIYEFIEASYVAQDMFVVSAKTDPPVSTSPEVFYILVTVDNGVTWEWHLVGEDYLDPAWPRTYSLEDDRGSVFPFSQTWIGHTTNLVEVATGQFIIGYSTTDTDANQANFLRVINAPASGIISVGPEVEVAFSIKEIVKVDTNKVAIATLTGVVLAENTGGGTSISVGTEAPFLDGGSNMYTINPRIASTNSSTVVAVRFGNDYGSPPDCDLPPAWPDSFTHGLYVTSGSVSGLTLTWAEEAACTPTRGEWTLIKLLDHPRSIPDSISHVEIVSMDDGGNTWLVLASVAYLISPAQTVQDAQSYACAGTANGTTVTVGTPVTNTWWDGEIDAYYDQLLRWEDDKALVVVSEVEDATSVEERLQAGIITLTGLVPSYSSLTTIHEHFPPDQDWKVNFTFSATILSANTFAVMYKQETGVKAKPVNYGAMRWTKDGGDNLSLNEKCDNVLSGENFSDVNSNMFSRTIAIHSISSSPDVWLAAVSGYKSDSVNDPEYYQGIDSRGLLSVIDYHDLSNCAVPNNGPVVGMSLDKSLGKYLWITVRDKNVDELRLGKYELLSGGRLQLVNQASLGGCTAAELTARTYFAAPFSPWTYGDVCYVYGRMDDPEGIGAGSGSIAHIIKTVDGGTTWVDTGNDLLTPHFGALWVDLSGRMYAILNSASPVLYVDNYDEVLVSKVVLTNLGTDIELRQMALNFFTLGVYAISGTSGAVMVNEIQSPYSSASNITYDHPTGAAGKGIVIL
jgi:hypothetical protein